MLAPRYCKIAKNKFFELLEYPKALYHNNLIILKIMKVLKNRNNIGMRYVEKLSLNNGQSAAKQGELNEKIDN